jgi:hypothetical protein
MPPYFTDMAIEFQHQIYENSSTKIIADGESLTEQSILMPLIFGLMGGGFSTTSVAKARLLKKYFEYLEGKDKFKSIHEVLEDKMVKIMKMAGAWDNLEGEKKN